jgi:hypothetical protein
MAAKQGRSKGGQRLVQQEPIEATKAGSGTRAAETKRGATRDVGRLKEVARNGRQGQTAAMSANDGGQRATGGKRQTRTLKKRECG